jgi:hypothetical protein
VLQIGESLEDAHGKLGLRDVNEVHSAKNSSIQPLKHCRLVVLWQLDQFLLGFIRFFFGIILNEHGHFSVAVVLFLVLQHFLPYFFDPLAFRINSGVVSQFPESPNDHNMDNQVSVVTKAPSPEFRKPKSRHAILQTDTVPSNRMHVLCLLRQYIACVGIQVALALDSDIRLYVAGRPEVDGKLDKVHGFTHVVQN